MDALRFQAVQQYVDFSPECETRLRRFLDVARSDLSQVVDDFYTAISRDPAASVVITGGPTQVERLKSTLHQWLTSLLEGPHDAAYVDSRNRIGRVHVRINLSQEYMLTAVDRVRLRLVRIAHARLPPSEALPTADAIHRALDLDLVLMLDTYRADWNSRIDASARLAAVGQIAASIGHELRNPLGVVESSLFLINQRISKLGLNDGAIEKHLGRIQEQVGMCSETITSLLELVRDAPLLRTQFALASVLEHCLRRAPAPANVTVCVNVPDGLLVYADQEQLASVVSNLLRNAFEAIADSTNKQVTLTATVVGGGIELLVEDSGAGVLDAHRSHIFDVLFTTRPKGTGLGLALCKKIVERHGGEISLLTTKGEGATFRVWLPTLTESSTSGSGPAAH